MESVIALIGFVFISTITPGPNNFLLAASGLRFGIRETVPHVMGIHAGVYSLVILCGLGLGRLITEVPAALLALKIFGSVYLAYLAFQIIGFDLDVEEGEEIRKPMTAMQAGLFQFSNPKAWMMATTGLNIGFSAGGDTWSAIALLCLGFASLGICCNFTWVWLGASMRQFLDNPRKRVMVNGVLSIVTVATIAMLWLAD